MNKHEAIEVINNIDTLSINDMITGQNVDMVIKNQVIDIISKIDTQLKPRVPQVAVEFYEAYKDRCLSFEKRFGDFYSEEAEEDFPHLQELAKWLYDNPNEVNQQRELALATLIVNGPDAVEIEREQLYTAELFNGQPLVEVNNVLYFSSDLVAPNACVSKDKLELAGFGWVFDCNGVKVMEVER